MDTSQINTWGSLVMLVVLAASSAAQMTDPATLSASLKNDKNYSLLVPCVNQCLWDVGNNDAYSFGGDIALQLSCGSPYPNGCYCRPQSATFAKSFIASCATRLCTRSGGALPQDADIASGQAIYASYCSAALGAAYTPDAVQQAPAPTAIQVPGGISISAASRSTARQPTQTGGSSANPSVNANPSTETSPSNSNDQPDKKIMGLSMGAFIGVVVSIVCSVLGLIFGIGFKVYKHKKQQKMQAQMHQGVTGVYYTTKH